MSQALTPGLLLGALILCVAGAAKLRAPQSAARAARTIGLPASPVLIRVFALAEVATGCWCAVRPSPISAGLLAAFYGSFVGLTFALARVRASCGCFGEGDAPASWLQAVLSASLCLIAIAAAFAGTHGFTWVFHRDPLDAAVLIMGSLAATYGVVLAYTELPSLWAAWGRA